MSFLYHMKLIYYLPNAQVHEWHIHFDVIIDFARSRVADHSGLEAIDTLADRYVAAGKTLRLVHLSDECRRLLKRRDTAASFPMHCARAHASTAPYADASILCRRV